VLPRPGHLRQLGSTLKAGLRDRCFALLSLEIVDAEGLEQRHTLQGSLVVIMKNGREQEHFLHSDHLGSVTSITDDRGEVIERFDYDAWGHRRDLAGARELINYRPVSKHRFGFTGQEMLDAVDLVHMNGRVYDPAIGRFLSPDPFVQAPENLQSLNRYSYVWNNPLSHTDPSGYFLESIARGVGQLLGGVVGGVGDGLNGIGRAGQRFGSWISKPQNQRLVAALAISAVGGWGLLQPWLSMGGSPRQRCLGSRGLQVGM
jgi:RHS repeat-associated protein